MPVKSKSNQFGHIARTFHWASALIVLCLLAIGYYMAEMAFSPFKLELYTYHKSFGMIILGLTVLRVIWKHIDVRIKPLDTHTRLEHFLSKFIHILLYIGLIGMPISGWLMSNAGEFPNSFFGLFEFPHLVEKNEELFKLTRSVHSIFAYMLILAIGLHIVGALKHHIIDKDNTLKRMGGNIVLAVIGIAILCVPVYFIVLETFEKLETTSQATQTHTKLSSKTTTHTDNQWIIDYQNSKIAFIFTQYGENISGHFDQWDATVIFDKEDLENSSAAISIDIASIKTGSDDRDQQAISTEWFSQADFPKAHFKSTHFEKTSENSFIIHGDLNLRGITQNISFPFKLQGDKAKTVVNAEFPLSRLHFGIGQGQWKETNAIGDQVDISIHLTAHQEN